MGGERGGGGERKKNSIELEEQHYRRIVIRNRLNLIPLFIGRKLNASVTNRLQRTRRRRRMPLPATSIAIDALTIDAPVVVLPPLVSPSNYREQMRGSSSSARSLHDAALDIASSHDENLRSTLFVANNREIDRRKTTCENIVPP